MNRPALIVLHVVRGLGRWYRARLRATDIAILWPTCKDQASDMATARMAFAFHAMKDWAWTTDFPPETIAALVEKLQ